MLLWALRTPVVMPGWHIWERGCRKHTPLLYELEAICPKCGSPGLDLCRVCLPTCTQGREWTGLSVSRLWSVCSCCPHRCGHTSLRPGVRGRRLWCASE